MRKSKAIKAHLLSIFAICLMFFPVLILAQQIDTLGTEGRKIVEQLTKYGVPDTVGLYTTISGLLGWLLTRFITWVLKKTKTTWYWNPKTQQFAVNWLWKILSAFFGKNILFYKPEFKIEDTATSDKAIQAKIDLIKEHFKKHDPLLSIDIK